MEAEDLTPEQTEMLVQLQVVSNIQELETVRRMLEEAEWNLELAISRIFPNDLSSAESSSSVPPVDPVAGPSSPPGPRQRQPFGPNVVRDPVVAPNNNRGDRGPENQVSLLGSLLSLITYPFNFVFTTLYNLFRFTLSLLGADSSTDPMEDVNSFILSFKQDYGEKHPQFYPGTYRQALDEAKKNLKFLLVYLHSDQHQDTPTFCRSVLTHHEVISYLTRNGIVFWACSVRSGEGHRVSHALREHSYPFLALIVLKETRMTVVRRFEGNISVERLLSQVQQGINDNEGSLQSARASRQAVNMNREIIHAQDRAYEESLEADRKKAEEKKKQEREKQDQERLEKLKQQQEQDRRNNLIKLKEELQTVIPPLREEEDHVRVIIKMPDGSRLEGTFNRDDSIKYLMFFVFAKGGVDLLNFEVITNFPRKVLPCPSPTLENPDCQLDGVDAISFREASLGASEMLFVRDLDA